MQQSIIATGADPWVFQKDGFYYYTNTTGNNVRVRKASRITGTYGLGTATAVTVFTPKAGRLSYTFLAANGTFITLQMTEPMPITACL